jgi:hypothetical protein
MDVSSMGYPEMVAIPTGKTSWVSRRREVRLRGAHHAL